MNHKDKIPNRYKLYHIASTGFRFLAVPCLLFYSVIGFLVILIEKEVEADAFFMAFGNALLIIAPFAIVYRICKRRREKVDAVVSNLRATGQFSPSYEARTFWDTSYMGLDTHNGTILYILIWPGGKYMDVIGFGSRDFLKTEFDPSCSILTCNTKLVSFPVIAVKTKSFVQDLIYTMTSRHYEYAEGFFNLVKDKRKELEKLAGIPIPEVH